LLIFAAALYAVSYELFRHFDLTKWDAFSDAKWYLLMAGESDEILSNIHKYRQIIPLLVEGLSNTDLIIFLENYFPPNYPDDLLRVRLAFYILNFIFSLGAAFLLYQILCELGLGNTLSIIGGLLFISSRTLGYSTSLPLVDAGFFFSISFFVYINIANKPKYMSAVFPILVLIKEVIMPFFLLGLLIKRNRNLWYYFVLVASLIIYLIFRVLADTAISMEQMNSISSSSVLFFEIITNHLLHVWSNLQTIFSLRGLHNLFHGFTFIFILSIFGMVIVWRLKEITLQLYIFLISVILLSLLLALMSGNLGRLFFSAFIPVIFFALITVREFMYKE